MYLHNGKIDYFITLILVVFCNLVVFIKAHNRHGFGSQRYGPIQSFGNEPSSFNQPVSTSTCKFPVFSDSAKFYLDECQQGSNNNEHPVCQGQINQRIPASWKGTMICTSRIISVKFLSTCTQNGEWKPSILKNCAELFLQSFQTFQEIPQKESNSQIQESNSQFLPSQSSPSFDSGLLSTQEQNLPQEQDGESGGLDTQFTSPSSSSNTKTQITSEVTDTRQSLPCFQLKVEMDERFIFSCIFPGHRQESECVSLKMVDHGTKAILKCKRPYKSVSGRPNSWMCINGAWEGATNKIICATSPPPQAEPPSKNVQNVNSNQQEQQQKQHSQLVPSSNDNYYNVPSNNKIPTSPIFNEPQSTVFQPSHINSNTRTTTSIPLVLPIDIRQSVQYENRNNNNNNNYIPAPTNSKLGESSNSHNQEQFSPSYFNNNAQENNNNNNNNNNYYRNTSTKNNAPSSNGVYNSKVLPLGSKNNEQQFLQQPTAPTPFPFIASDKHNNEQQIQYNSDNNKKSTIVPNHHHIDNYKNDNKNQQSTIMCPALLRRPPGVRIECVFKQHFVSTTSCESPMPINTEARYYCDEFYETAVGLTTLFRKCKEDGTWTGASEQFSCIVQCGKSNIVRVPYITHGTPSVRGQWPWNAGLFLKEELSSSQTTSSKFTFICGGSLLSSSVVLTAAHCVTISETTTKREANTIRVDLGKYFRENSDELVQSRIVQKIIVHPSYSPYGYDSDIALLILEEPIKITYHVQPICFPQSTETAIEELHLSPNSYGTVLGWGKDETGRLSDKLQMTRLPVVSPRDCLENVKDGLTTELQTRSTTYCAGFKNGTNVCNGDSGAGMFFPASVNGQSRWFIQGIVSIGIPTEKGECDPTKYTVFTRVGRFAEFILRTLSENSK